MTVSNDVTGTTLQRVINDLHYLTYAIPDSETPLIEFFYLESDGKAAPSPNIPVEITDEQFALSVKKVFGKKPTKSVKILLKTDVENVYLLTTEYTTPIPIKEYAFTSFFEGAAADLFVRIFHDETVPFELTAKILNEDGSIVPKGRTMPPTSRLIYVASKKDEVPFRPEYLTTWTDANGEHHLAYLETEDGVKTLQEIFTLEEGFIWIGNKVTDTRKCLFRQCKKSKVGGAK